MMDSREREFEAMQEKKRKMEELLAAEAELAVSPCVAFYYFSCLTTSLVSFV